MTENIIKYNIKAVLFDLDNTLCNTEDTKIAVFEKVYEEVKKYQKVTIDKFISETLNIREDYLVEVSGLQSYSRLRMWNQITNTFDLSLTTKELVKSIETYWRYSISELKLFENAREVLEKIFYSDCKVAVLASGDFYSKSKKIIELGIDCLFNYVFTADIVKIEKTDPKINKFVAKKLDLKPENILLAGNTLEFDIEPANKAGMKTALVNINQSLEVPQKGFRRPNFIINNLTGILNLVGLN